jgi:hypothetical protein
MSDKLNRFLKQGKREARVESKSMKLKGKEDAEQLKEFNEFHIELHPDGKEAKQITTIAAKGTSFDDKKQNCIDFCNEIADGETWGEVVLVPEPSNQYDPNALRIQCAESGKMLGYVQKADGVNKLYIDNLEKLVGAYVVKSKKGQRSCMLIVACGWNI